MAIALILDANGYIAQIADSVALQADSFERKQSSGNLVVGSTLGAEELRLGSAASLVHSLGDLQVDGFIEVLDMSAPGNPSDAEGRLYKLTGSSGLWWINDSWGTAIDLTALPPNFIDGLRISRNATHPAYQVDIAVGWCRSDDDTTNLKTVSPITVSLATSGANGLDTGSEASSAWYFIYVIYNPTTRTYAGLFSTSSTSPTMPSGYTKKRRIGSTYNNTAGNFWAWTQTVVVGRYRKYMYDAEDADNLFLLNGGTATTYTDVNCRTLVPATSNHAVLGYLYVGGDVASYGNIRTNGLSIVPAIFTAPGGTSAISALSNGAGVFEVRTDSSGIIEYRNYAASEFSYIWGIGYIEEL